MSTLIVCSDKAKDTQYKPDHECSCRGNNSRCPALGFPMYQLVTIIYTDNAHLGITHSVVRLSAATFYHSNLIFGYKEQISGGL